MASNNDGYQNHNRASTITVTVLALVFVLLRFIARYVNNKGYGIEDILLTLAMIGDLILLALDLDAVNHGLGLYLVDFPLEYFQLCNQLIFAYELIWNLTMATIKISVLLLYWRVFIDKPTRTITRIIGLFVISWAIAAVFVTTFQCVPVNKFWNPFVPGHCINRLGYYLGGSIPNILSDIAMLCLPIRSVWKLHCSMTTRISLTCVFILGGFVLFASFYRLVPIVAYSSDETSYSAAINLAWATIEVSCAIISACLPTLRPLLRLVWRGFDSTNRSVSNNPYPTRNSQRVQQSHPAGHFSDEEPLRAISVETRIDITALPNAPERSWFVERVGVT